MKTIYAIGKFHLATIELEHPLTDKRFTFPHNWRCSHAKYTGKFSIISIVEYLQNCQDAKSGQLKTEV